MPRPRISVLGTAAISPAGLSQQPKRLALLVYLAISRPRGARRRDELLGLLWPELDQDRARSALRQALHGLRKALGDDVIRSYGAELVELNAGAVSCDLWELEEAIVHADVEAIARLYQPELLRGMFVSGASELDSWIEAERAHVRDEVSGAFWHAAETCAGGRRADWVYRAVAIAPLNEAGVRRGMQLLAEHDDVAGALALFERLSAALSRELEVPPSHETHALSEKLRARRLSQTDARRKFGIAPADATTQSRDTGAENQVEFVAECAVSDPIETQPNVPARSTRWPRRTLYSVAAVMLVAITTIASAAVLSSRFGARDPRMIAVVSVFDATTNAASRARVNAAASAVRRAISSSNLFTMLDSGAGTSRAGTIIHIGVEQKGGQFSVTGAIVNRGGGILRDEFNGAWSAVDTDAWRMGAEKVAGTLAAALYPGWAQALSQPPNLSAYRAFTAGMDDILHERHRSAIALFRDAYRSDSTFTAAALLAGVELFQSGRFASADSVAQAIGLRRASLPDVDRALLDWLSGSLQGDRAASFAAMQEVVRLAPSAELAALQLATEAAENGDTKLSLQLFDRLRESPTFGENWLAYWSNRTEVLHMLGDHNRELGELQRVIRAHPEMTLLRNYELRARAALHDTAYVWPRLLVLGELDSFAGQEPPIVMRQVAMELRAHGDEPGAMRALAQAKAWYQRRVATDSAKTGYQLGLARVAYLQDDRETAARLYTRIRELSPNCMDCLGAIGVLAARAGNLQRVAEIDSVLAHNSRPYQFGRSTLWRARMFATAGNLQRARVLLSAAREQGLEIDVMSHADADLQRVTPISN